jgi:4-amino-4-deoxy-L-arabinose transferase-like glycosyltransferase
LLAGVLILAAAALHVAYLYRSPLDLAPDEAHYWDWSRHLDFSYYSKGPLVAYLIRGSCEICGDWAQRHTGSIAFAVRLPAVLCSSLLLVSLYILTTQVYRREGRALAVVAVALTFPLVSVGSSLMTIDAPYTCLWGWALVLGLHVTRHPPPATRHPTWVWPVLGVVVGLGILAKYTMVLFVPSLGLFLLTSAEHRVLLRRWGFWVMSLTAAVCCVPILVWNAQHGWVTVLHLLGHSGMGMTGEERPPLWLGPLIYTGQQCAMLLVFWFAVWAAAMIVHRPWREPEGVKRYLWWLSAPMFLAFLAFSPKNGGGEMNWPVTAYLSGLVLAVGWLEQQLLAAVTWRRRLAWGGLIAASLVGAALTGFIHYSDRFYPLLARVVGPQQGECHFPLRQLDPTCRLRGWRWLGAYLDLLRGALRDREGQEPILAGATWTFPGELGVYCAGHPQAYSVGLVTGDRHSQYDLWPNPVQDGDDFRGRTFVIVGGVNDTIQAAFEEVGPTVFLTHREHGYPVTGWFLTICRGFKGFPQPEGSHHF